MGKEPRKEPNEDTGQCKVNWNWEGTTGSEIRKIIELKEIRKKI